MQQFAILTDALEYIEQNLCTEIEQEAIAGNCYCSLSNLQKLFRYVFHFTIKEYIEKRRLTLAAQDIAKSELNITEIAYKYCYNSPEVFARAFFRVWGINPSAFRSKWRFSGLFPKIEAFHYFGKTERGILMRKQVDISEMYDTLKSLRGSYVLCFDLCNFMKFNEVSRELGDRGILEALHRIDSNSDENMLLFRIGGDEFALVTGLTDQDAVRAAAERILAHNGEPVTHKEHSMGLTMRAGAMKILSSNLRYHELYNNMQDAIEKTRESGEYFFFVE